jgi:hypothetical protein
MLTMSHHTIAHQYMTSKALEVTVSLPTTLIWWI